MYRVNDQTGQGFKAHDRQFFSQCAALGPAACTCVRARTRGAGRGAGSTRSNKAHSSTTDTNAGKMLLPASGLGKPRRFALFGCGRSQCSARQFRAQARSNGPAGWPSATAGGCDTRSGEGFEISRAAAAPPPPMRAGVRPRRARDRRNRRVRFRRSASRPDSRRASCARHGWRARSRVPAPGTARRRRTPCTRVLCWRYRP